MTKIIGCGRAWFLPVPIFRSNDDWGHAKGPFIYLPERVDKPFERHALYHHEIWHVKQWYVFKLLPYILSVVPYALTGYPPLLFLLAVAVVLSKVWWKKNRYKIEAAAYGESVRSGGDARRSATWLAHDHYGFDVSVDQAEKDILEYAENGKLI